ncbi:MAG: adenylate kinase [Bacteroidales bacterium]|nr:adenylate kinase [Bacteroidales bacterium]
MKEETIRLYDKTFKPYIRHDRIIEAIDGIAERINADYHGCKDVPVILCVLNGAIPFTGELLQRLEFNCQLISIKLSSYQGTKSTGTVLNVMGLTSSVRGRRVIICEDIVDTGNTIVALKEMLLDKEGAADVKICTMLLKPEVYNKPVKLDYVGMEIPNDFIVGFGLDYNEIGRNIKDIYVIDNPMKYYILFGPPGAGKGTHAGAIAQKFNLKHISTGELLRAEIAAGTELGRQAKSLIDAGSLVPDSVVEGMIESVFNNVKDVNGFLLDGFPRNLTQAADLDKILEKRGESVTAVIALMISDDTIRQRIKGRAVIEGRADDANDETITNRIRTYHAQTEPLKEYYKKAGIYYEGDVDKGSIEENRVRVLSLVDSIK